MKSTSAVLLGCACTVLFGCSTTVITVDGDAARDAALDDRFVLGDQELCGNGLDDDRDGEADEDCMCPTAGLTQRCSLAASFAVGCPEGTQTCTTSGELATWGSCSERSTVCGPDPSTPTDAAVPLDAHEPQEDTGPPIDNTLATYCRTLIPATENDYLPIGYCRLMRYDARSFCNADVRCDLAEYVRDGQGLSCSQLHPSNGLRQWVCVPVSAVPDGLRLIGS